MPEEVHLLNNVARLEAEVADAADSAVAARLSTDLQYARLRLALALEHLRAATLTRPKRSSETFSEI
ncbi:MAG: hypothetical protein DMF84_26680 [Acidobacteria bacterium]|nr:MAG: hypothetical protein DMF84_26680 [Acidobacteriota bacterium]